MYANTYFRFSPTYCKLDGYSSVIALLKKNTLKIKVVASNFLLIFLEYCDPSLASILNLIKHLVMKCRTDSLFLIQFSLMK